MAAVSTIAAVTLGAIAAGSSVHSAVQAHDQAQSAERKQKRDFNKLQKEKKEAEVSEAKNKVATGERAALLSSLGQSPVSPFGATGTILGSTNAPTQGVQQSKTLLGQ